MNLKRKIVNKYNSAFSIVKSSTFLLQFNLVFSSVIMGAMANNPTPPYVGWEQQAVSNEKGQRQLRYYLKRGCGVTDLVVIGKEGVKRMIYHYVKGKAMLLSKIKCLPMPKLRSRKEVINWLNSIISDSDKQPNCSVGQFGGDMETELDDKKFRTDKAEFMWLGSPWTCRKRRSHYQAFSRNNVVISVHDFVYVLAEENKRLVAYLDDIYEDSRGNKIAVVQWFHKIDEVGFVLPHFYNDREIFFSLCLQDLSIECIDGVATVLSPEHYENFKTEATHVGLVLFVCSRQFDNDDVKRFDITSLQGYSKQSILINKSFSAHEPFNSDFEMKGPFGDAVGCSLNKRIRWSKEFETDLKNFGKKVSVETNAQARGPLKQWAKLLAIGSQVEVLSQDSGIRGCWFRAVIIKKHKDSVKIQYLDIKDPNNDAKNLEEWILASRIAAADVLGIRIPRRTVVRPTRFLTVGKPSSPINVGSSVDAWWHDGWWEGIVLKKESEDKLHVYFPGEKREHPFSASDLRHSQDWIENAWENIKEMLEPLTKCSGLGILLQTDKACTVNQDNAQSSDSELVATTEHDDSPREVANGTMDVMKAKIKIEFVQDPSPKDKLLALLKWENRSWKAKRLRSNVKAKNKVGWGSNNRGGVYYGLHTYEKFYVNKPSLKFQTDNCKNSSNNHFSSGIINLVA